MRSGKELCGVPRLSLVSLLLFACQQQRDQQPKPEKGMKAILQGRRKGIACSGVQNTSLPEPSRFNTLSTQFPASKCQPAFLQCKEGHLPHACHAARGV